MIPDVPLHITQRGNDRVRTFHDERDYLLFRELLLEMAPSIGCAVHGYVLMPNHVHLLLTPSDGAAPARLMQRVGLRYVRYVNRTYVRTGTLWEGRYRSAVVDSERYLLACMRYIDLNPVRAGLANDPSLARWSSYRHNAMGEADPLVTPHATYLALGRSVRERGQAYAALCLGDLAPDVLRDLRHAVRRQPDARSARADTEFAMIHAISPVGLRHGAANLRLG